MMNLQNGLKYEIILQVEKSEILNIFAELNYKHNAMYVYCTTSSPGHNKTRAFIKTFCFNLIKFKIVNVY